MTAQESTTAIVTTPTAGGDVVAPVTLPALSHLTREQVETLKLTVAKDTTDAEFALFLEVCRFSGLNPFTRQIHCVVRQGKNRSVSFQTGIDGYRSQAEKTGLYAGQDAPEWCGPDGKWTDLWLGADPPAAARVKVYRRDWDRPAIGVARWDAYVQTTPVWGQERGEIIGHRPNSMWEQRGPEQLAKCAESLAFRIAFPQQMAGVYTDEEMAQADNGAHADEAAPARAARSASSPAATSRPKGEAKAAGGSAPNWNRFWAEVRELGLKPPHVHHAAGVESLKDWTAGALDELLQRIVDAGGTNDFSSWPPERLEALLDTVRESSSLAAADEAIEGEARELDAEPSHYAEADAADVAGPPADDDFSGYVSRE